jgi:hypothetical protein
MSGKPDEFQIANKKHTLGFFLGGLREELPWLKSESYDFDLDDIQEAIWLVTELGVVMQVSLGDLLGTIAAQYRVAQGDIPHSARLPRPKYGDLLDFWNWAKRASM